MKCKFCKKYEHSTDSCKFCKFEFNEEYDPYLSDDWDILNLDEESDWKHIQILDRLHLKEIDCYSADIWWDNNMAYLLGIKSSVETVAKVLNMHKECIYYDGESDFMILNLFQEKYMRGMFSENKE